jgi:hypothetical protein
VIKSLHDSKLCQSASRFRKPRLEPARCLTCSQEKAACPPEVCAILPNPKLPASWKVTPMQVQSLRVGRIAQSVGNRRVAYRIPSLYRLSLRAGRGFARQDSNFITKFDGLDQTPAAGNMYIKSPVSSHFGNEFRTADTASTTRQPHRQSAPP